MTCENLPDPLSSGIDGSLEHSLQPFIHQNDSTRLAGFDVLKNWAFSAVDGAFKR